MITDDEVLRTFAAADPARQPETADDSVAGADYLAELHKRSATVTLTDPNETTARSTRLWPWLGAVASVLIVGGFALILRDGESSDEAISTDRSVSQVDIDIAERFIEALNDRDQAAVDMLSGDATTFESVITFEPLAIEELAPLFAWYDAFEWRWDDASCAATAAATITCDLLERNRLTDLTAAQRPAIVTFTIGDGDVEAVRVQPDLSNYGPNAFNPFNRWVRTHHPEDSTRMWNRNRPVLTEQSATLLDRNLDEYEQVWIVDQFIDALNNRDQAAVDMFSAAATTFESVITADALAVDDLAPLFAWYDAFEWRWANTSCAATAAATITCDLLEENRLTDLTGAERPAVVTFTIADGNIGTVVVDADISAYSRVAFEPFWDWVQSNHPEDVTRMWDRERPILTPEAVEVFDRNLSEFVADATSTTDE